MQSLFSLIPLWLAATVVGLPLQSSPGDTWRSEVDHGISGSRRHREVMPWLHLHDHPRATVVEVVLGESQSRLRKRGIIQDVRGKVHEWYRKTRNDMWSSRDEQRCLIRKRREFDRINQSQEGHTGIYSDGDEPTQNTKTRWGEICSTWEDANADTKDAFIGETIRDKWLRMLVKGQGLQAKKWRLPDPTPDDEEDTGASTPKFIKGGQGLLQQAWRYMSGEGKAGMTSPGVAPSVGGKFMMPIGP